MNTDGFSVQLERTNGYEFAIDLVRAGLNRLHMDEPPPLGDGREPNATRVLAAAIGNCPV